MAVRVLILGATGYLGRPLYDAFRKTLDFQVIGTSRKASNELIQVDITENSAPQKVINHLKNSEDTVLFLSAISKPELCQSDFMLANQVNVKSTREMISRILENGNRVLFFSSDTVYGEQHHPGNENPPLSPVGPYAIMKARIEEEFLSHTNFKSIRISYVYSPYDSLTKYLRNSVENVCVAQIFHPFSRNVIYRNDFIEGVLALVRNWIKCNASSINFGGPETINRIQYADILKNTLLPTLKYEVISPAPSFYALRPQAVKMHSVILNQLLGRTPRKVQEALLSEDYVKEWNIKL